MAEGRFMVAVGALIENTKTGKILLIQRTRKADFAPGIWEPITGRMKQFEELEEALRREVREETGIRDLQIVKPLTVSHFFRGERVAEQEIILILYWAQTGADEVVLSDEHEAYQWVSPQEALSLTAYPGFVEDIEAFIKERK